MTDADIEGNRKEAEKLLSGQVEDEIKEQIANTKKEIENLRLQIIEKEEQVSLECLFSKLDLCNIFTKSRFRMWPLCSRHRK